MFETVDDLTLRLDLRDALTRLRPKQRQAVELHMQGFTQAEIGRACGVNQSSVSRALARAEANLRRFCGESA